MAIIRRTIEKKTATGLFMDAFRQIEERSFDIPENIKSEEQAEKWYRKNYNGKLVEVLSIDTDSKLYGMEEADFCRISKAFTERSKETRGLITKNVSTTNAKCLVMDNNRTIKEVVYVGVDNEKKARKASSFAGDKFIEILELLKSETLYGCTNEEFISNARLMKDDFHFAD